MSWEIVVGIETHAHLLTRSKIFSGAPTAFGAAPNSQASAVDIALPGVLPVLNRAALEHAVRFALAIGAKINRRSVFARKNYFYPDLPKGYQISQYELPIVQGGSLKIRVGNAEKVVRLTRAHLEEDAGKSLHEDFHGMTGIDLNRAGTPLLEIVSEPDLRGAEEAVAYARELHDLVMRIGICDGNMQEGSFRCDANVSVRKVGETKLGTRCELKNPNSFRFMHEAIEYEARRQIELIESGASVSQETRLYDPDKGETRPLRTKEDAQDYRYFPDPDLLPVIVGEELIEVTRRKLPKLKEAQRAEFIAAGATEALATQLTATVSITNFASAALREAPKENVAEIANWIVNVIGGKLNADNLDFSSSPVPASQLRRLAERVADGTLSGKLAREVLDAMWVGEGDVDAVIERRGLRQISDASAIEKLVDEVLAANARQVADYRSGKEKAFNSLVGQVMKATRGKANPAQVNEILRRRLG